MKTQSYPGAVEKGKFIPDDPLSYSQRFYPHEGKRVLESVHRQRKPRSNQQNRYLWGVVYKLIGDQIGESAEAVHDLMKFYFNCKFVVIKQKNTRIPQSTAKLSTVELEDYAEKIRRWAAEFLDLYIPLPNEVPDFEISA